MTRSITSTKGLHDLFVKQGEVEGLLLHDDRMLLKDTLLVHFTSVVNARRILEEGFRRGVEDVRDLGLTEHLIPGGPGFNYAFVAGDHPDLWSDEYCLDFVCGLGGDEEDRYGVVMLRAAAVHTYHWDDLLAGDILGRGGRHRTHAGFRGRGGSRRTFPADDGRRLHRRYGGSDSPRRVRFEPEPGP